MDRCSRQKILIATRNRGKVKEIERLLSIPQLDFVSLGEIAPDLEIKETGTTYLENALIKAREAAQATGLIAIADDSGLEVDALDGAPGVFSARYAGKDGDDEANIARLLAELADVPDEERTARFRCVAVAFFPEDDTYLTAEAVCDGHIIREKRGSGGFGYDPVFVPDGYDRTFAELPLSVKNRISHRAKAFRLMRRKLVDYLDI